MFFALPGPWPEKILTKAMSMVKFSSKVFRVFTMAQGPKLTVLCRRQVATEIFFSVAKWKNLVAKKWFVKFLLHSEHPARKH